MKIDTYITNIYKWSYNFYSQVSFPQPEAIGQKKGKNIKQNWPRQENSFDICLYVSFDCYCQKLIAGAETGH